MEGIQSTTFCPMCSIHLSYPAGSTLIQCPQCSATIDPNVPQQTRCVNCKTLLAYPPNSLFIQCPKCFTKDTRVLTNYGLLFLEEIQALQAAFKQDGDSQPLLYACYDKSLHSLVYRTGKLVFPPSPKELVDITSPDEASRWEEGSGVRYGLSGKQADVAEEGMDVLELSADEAAEAAAASLNRHVSLLVTPDHKLFAQFGNEDQNGFVSWENSPPPAKTVNRQRGKQQQQQQDSPVLDRIDAKDLLCDSGFKPDKSHIRMLACADSGLVCNAADSSFARARIQLNLGLDLEQFGAFLSVLGFWLGDGSIDYRTQTGGDNAVVFAQKKKADTAWLLCQLEAVGLPPSNLQLNEEGGNGVVGLRVVDDRWFTWFDQEFGYQYENSVYYQLPSASPAARMRHAARTSQPDVDDADCMGDEEESSSAIKPLIEEPRVKLEQPSIQDEQHPTTSSKWFPYWVLMHLSPEELRCVLEGVRRAVGCWESDRNVIFTSSVRFRDQLMQALLHCGFSPYAFMAYTAGTVRGYNSADQRCGAEVEKKVYSVNYVDSLSKEEQAQFYPIKATTDAWVVTWCEPTSGRGEGACWPTLRRETCISTIPYDESRDGQVWCVMVDHDDHLIVAQRAERDDNGIVIQQSRPVIVGQCMSTMDPRQQGPYMNHLPSGSMLPPGGPLQKLTKKRRDPNAPKAVSNAYMIFCKARRGELKQENPDLPFGKIGAKLGEIWRMMTPEEKKPYEDRATVDRERYRKEMLDYQTGKHAGTSGEKKSKGEGGTGGTGGGGGEGDAEEGEEGDTGDGEGARGGGRAGTASGRDDTHEGGDGTKEEPEEGKNAEPEGGSKHEGGQGEGGEHHESGTGGGGTEGEGLGREEADGGVKEQADDEEHDDDDDDDDD